MKLSVSPLADLDLVEIWEYIGAHDPVASDRVIDRIEAFMLGPLLEFPKMGRERNGLSPGLRGFSLRPYIVFYCVHPSEVEVVRVLHGARDIAALFEEE